MQRENSFSDSDGQSITPDISEDEGVGPPISPTYARPPRLPVPTSQETPSDLKSAPAILTKPKPSSSVGHGRPSGVSVRIGEPNARFRAAARKVIALKRGTSMMSNNPGGNGESAGAEPGVDPRRASAEYLYGGIQQNCTVEIFDYSSVRSSYGKMTNKEFVDVMDSPAASEKEKWVRVRWINIGGMSWDVIKAVSIRYNLHPLALEDVFHARKQTRSKADYYPQHLFLRVLAHELADAGDTQHDMQRTAERWTPPEDSISRPIYSEPQGISEDDGSLESSFGSPGKGPSRDTTKDYRQEEQDPEDMPLGGLRRGLTRRIRGRRQQPQRPLLPTARPAEAASAFSVVDPMAYKRRVRKQEAIALDALKNIQERVKVQVTPMFIFLLRDGTVISIHPNSAGSTEFTSAITARLQQRDTGLRKSADPSMLVHSLLDLVVDKALEVTDEYQFKIEKFERQILISPKMRTVQDLHMLDGDLILLKRTMGPLRTLVYGLRRYDLDRCAALAESEGVSKERVVGYMSSKSKIYLADVHDHMEYILASLDMFANISENLIDYAFNMTSYKTNETMRKLTLVTIIFLPLTLLTGYFGMNFEDMWSLRRSDLFFWELALPVLTVVIAIFLTSDLQRMWHYIEKNIIYRRAIRQMKNE